MRRTGSTPLAAALGLVALLAAAPARAELEFYQQTDRTEVGLEDTFRLTVVVADAPRDAEVRFPASEDFEVLSRSQSSQRSVNIGPQGADIRTSLTYVLVMRATRTGTLTVPPAVLETRGEELRTRPIQITVKQGSLGGGVASRPAARDPLRELFEGRLGGLEEELSIPRSDSDLFLRTSVDKRELYVGEQLTLSLHVFSRVDLSSVDSVTMPKLDGFWSEDLDSPTQLAADTKVIDGVPYRAFLLKRRAVFPVKPGKVRIEPAEADITTGFLFAGRRVHRKGNAVEVNVKPLPPNAPKGFNPANVGQWSLSTEVTATEVELGQPITVRVVLEGTGNLKNVSPPSLQAPASMKVYDPTPSDKLTVARTQIAGRKVLEYLVMPQQTGTFTLAPLEFPYFDPRNGRYEVARSEPLTITVTPGPGAAPIAGAPASPSSSTETQLARNVLQAGGVRPLRHQAHFAAPAPPAWTRGYFLPIVLAPVGLWAALGLVGWARGRLRAQDPAALKRRQAKVARQRLAGAEKLRSAGSGQAFYGEVEKALASFLEAKLGEPIGGLTRDQLRERMAAAGVGEERRARVIAVLDGCDLGRFAPGMDGGARDRILDDAAAAMEGWEK